MRFRETDANTTSRSYRSRWSQYGTTIYDTLDLHTRVTRHKRMLDVVTPGFSVLRNNGGIICSPMLAEEFYYDCDQTVGSLVGTYNGGGPILWDSYTMNGLQGVGASLLPSNGDPSSMQTAYSLWSRETDLAIMRAHGDVDLSEMAILATLGELPETLRWIYSIVKRIKDLTRFFRGRIEVTNVLQKLRYNAAERGSRQDFKSLESYIELLKRRKLRKTPTKIDNALLDLWLEWRYAVRPLIFDLQNAIAALEKVIATQRFTARGKELNKGEESSSWSNEPSVLGNDYATQGTILTRESIKARAGCLYVVDANLSSFLDIIGLDQPLESAYELIPFSFVLDWVFSVGDWLNGIFKSSGLSILTSWVTLSIERSESRRVTSVKLNTDRYYNWTGQSYELGSSHSVVKWKWRVPNPTFPSLPRFDLKLNLAKIIDLGAIARNTMNGRSAAVARRN